MTLDDLVKIGELVSALVVLVSLIYVAVQLRSNNQIAQTSGHRDIIAQFNDWYKEMEDPSLVKIIVRGARDFDELSFEDKLRFDTYIHRFMHMVEQSIYMGRDHYIPRGFYDAFIRGALAFTSYGAAKWWSQAQLTFSPDLTTIVETARQETPDTPPIWELFPTFIFAHKNEKSL